MIRTKKIEKKSQMIQRDLLPFVQFKKREKHPWRSVNFSKAETCNFTKINAPPRVFFTFFKLDKRYQIY